MKLIPAHSGTPSTRRLMGCGLQGTPIRAESLVNPLTSAFCRAPRAHPESRCRPRFCGFPEQGGRGEQSKGGYYSLPQVGAGTPSTGGFLPGQRGPGCLQSPPSHPRAPEGRLGALRASQHQPLGSPRTPAVSPMPVTLTRIARLKSRVRPACKWDALLKGCVRTAPTVSALEDEGLGLETAHASGCGMCRG